MSSSDSHTHDDDAEPVTDQLHDNSWSANLEKPKYSGDIDRALDDAVDAIEHTVAGNHVNLVTHADLGHPDEFLYEALVEEYGEDDIEWEYVDQCGCGGHVTRVHVY
jgi:putative CGCGG family rSAM target protein